MGDTFASLNVGGSITNFHVNFMTENIAPGFLGDFQINAGTGGQFITFRALNDAQSVPEPGSLLLLATGLAGWGVVRRRRSA